MSDSIEMSSIEYIFCKRSNEQLYCARIGMLTNSYNLIIALQIYSVNYQQKYLSKFSKICQSCGDVVLFIAVDNSVGKLWLSTCLISLVYTNF